MNNFKIKTSHIFFATVLIWGFTRSLFKEELSPQEKLLQSLISERSGDWKSDYSDEEGDRIDSAWNGQYRVRKFNQYGAVGIAGNSIITSTYNYLSHVFEGKCIAKNQVNRWGILDSVGTQLSNFVYDSAVIQVNGHIAVSYNGHWKYWNTAMNDQPVLAETPKPLQPEYVYLLDHNRMLLSSTDGLVLRNETHFYSFLPYPYPLSPVGFRNNMWLNCSNDPTQRNECMLLSWQTYDPEIRYFSVAATEVYTPKLPNVPIRIKIDDHYDFILPQQNYARMGKKWTAAGDFSEGLAWVCNGAYCGYIDATGEIVIPLNFLQAGDFNEGLAPVEWQNRWGYINKQGDWIIPATYSKAKTFSNGMAWVQTYTSVVRVVSDTVWCNVSHFGGTGFPLNSAQMVYPFSDGVALVRSRGSGQYGYIRTDNKWHLAYQYDLATPFQNGIAYIAQWDRAANRYFYAAINMDGQLLMPFETAAPLQLKQYFANLN